MQTHVNHKATFGRPGGSLTAGKCAPVRHAAVSRSVLRPVAANNPVAGEKYDYIVVGGGTAGSVLANRLTADGSKRVLVLEAGGSTDNAFEVKVPAGLVKLFKHPVFDWGLNSLTQAQLKAREIYLARGKALGGSSCTNATLYHRGTAADYDNWGLEGWSAKDVLDSFVQAESYAQGPAAYHGMNGTMNTEQPRYQNVLHDEFFKAASAVGMPANPDFNDWSRPQTGYGEFQVAQRKGERADMYRTYLKPAMGRSNLKVVTGARSTKVHIDKSSQGSTARGVEFSTTGPFGERHTAELAAGGEVVLSAGAVHSPHLLMLSGVGSARQLSEYGINCVSDVAGVGANLQDHPATVVSYKSRPEFEDLSVTWQLYDSKNNLRIKPVLQYLFGRNGPLTTTGCDHGAFASTKGSSQPDLQIRFVPAMSLDADGVKAYHQFAELKNLGLSWPGGFTFQCIAIRPQSRGSVGLKSSDPFSSPNININYFSDKDGEDLATMKAGLALGRQIASAGPLAKYAAEEKWPGSSLSSDAQMEDYIRRTVHSANALVGTCAMGEASNGGVVSPTTMAVHGVNGLRVVDASVMPTIPGGQTGAATVMIAERAAAVILANRVKAPAAPARVPALA